MNGFLTLLIGLTLVINGKSHTEKPPKIVVEFEYSGTVKSLLSDSLKFSIQYNLFSFRDSSIVDFSGNQQEINYDENVALNFPDKIIFKNGKWFKIGKKQELIPFLNESFTKTKEEKIILGYRCIKNVCTNVESKETSEVWVCPKLPNNIMPAAGCNPMDGAILEINSPSESYKAKKIFFPKIRKA